MVKLAKFDWVQDQINAITAAVTAQVVEVVASADTTAARNNDMRALFPMTKALREGNARILVMGDSKTEGTGVPSTAERWQNILRSSLRTKYSTADTGKGYIPAKYGTFYPLSDAPVITGSFIDINNQSGLGNRSVLLHLGSQVTFAAVPLSATVPLVVHWTRNYGMGTMEVLTGGVVRATVNVEGAPGPQSTLVTTPAGTADVVLRPKTGTAAIRVEGIFNATSVTGVKVLDGSKSGSTSRMYGEGMVADGSPESQTYHWSIASTYDPHGIIMAFGANDMSVRTPAEWAADLQLAVTKAKAACPNAGIVILHGTELTERAETGSVREYESEVRRSFADDAKVSIFYESSMWLPRAGVDYTWGGPEGWLADTVHTGIQGHAEIARMFIQKLIGDGATSSGGGGGASVSTDDFTGVI